MSATLNVSAVYSRNLRVTEQLTLGSATSPAIVSTPGNYSEPNGVHAADGAIDLHYEDPATGVTLAASATHTYTLSALTDGLGRTIPFAHIRDLVLTVLSRTAGDHLTMGPGVTHGWTALIASGTIPVYDDFAYHVDQTDGLVVTASSSDQLTITNAGSNPITYTLALTGTHD